jgi:hypothetical protein
MEVRDMDMDMDIEIRDMAIEDKEKDIASVTTTIEVRQNGITDHFPDRKSKKLIDGLAINKSGRWQE